MTKLKFAWQHTQSLYRTLNLAQSLGLLLSLYVLKALCLKTHLISQHILEKHTHTQKDLTDSDSERPEASIFDYCFILL